MATPPTIKTDTPPTAAQEEATFLAKVAHVEHLIDAWLSSKDRSQAWAVKLPRVDLDAAVVAELERRYMAAGWASATIAGDVLTLAATAGVAS